MSGKKGKSKRQPAPPDENKKRRKALSGEIRLPEMFFDKGKGTYWMRLPDGSFLELSKAELKIQIMDLGQRLDMENDIGLTNGDQMLAKIQREKNVDWAGPLAGHKSGLFRTLGGANVLVTSERVPVQPKKGDFPHIENYLFTLLGQDQMLFFMLWLKCAWESLVRHDFRPGQMVAICGHGGCGKGLFHWLITQIFGGRAELPYRYMSGKTNFNAELLGAEHLYIEDEKSSSGYHARREFGAAIKQWTVNEELSLHAKGKTGIRLPTWHRLSFSCNLETEFLIVLPPIDQSIEDKIALLKCEKAITDPDRLVNQRNFFREMPAFVAFFLSLKIPKTMRDERFGVKAYHNPELLDQLADTSEELRLLSLIEEILFSRRESTDFEGPAVELEKELRNSSFNFAVDKLLAMPNSCGVYLARLERKFPERFSQHKRRGQTIWLIKKEK